MIRSSLHLCITHYTFTINTVFNTTTPFQYSICWTHLMQWFPNTTPGTKSAPEGLLSNTCKDFNFQHLKLFKAFVRETFVAFHGGPGDTFKQNIFIIINNKYSFLFCVSLGVGFHFVIICKNLWCEFMNSVVHKTCTAWLLRQIT